MGPTRELGTVAERVERMERENWLMKRIGGIALLAVAALVFLGQAGQWLQSWRRSVFSSVTQTRGRVELRWACFRTDRSA
jgi:CHASE2 domain-containing sensor protein